MVVQSTGNISAEGKKKNWLLPLMRPPEDPCQRLLAQEGLSTAPTVFSHCLHKNLFAAEDYPWMKSSKRGGKHQTWQQTDSSNDERSSLFAEENNRVFIFLGFKTLIWAFTTQIFVGILDALVCPHTIVID